MPSSNSAKPEAGSGTSVQTLIAGLGSPRYAVRSDAFDALLTLGAKALEPLAWALDSTDAEVRIRAAEILIRLRGRGYMGVAVLEDWGGERPFDALPSTGGRPTEAEKGKEQEKDLARSQPLVRVEELYDQQPARDVGIEVGDHILSVNGQSIHGLYDLMRVVILAGPKKASVVVLERNDRRVTITMNLGRHPDDPIPPVDLMGKSVELQKNENERSNTDDGKQGDQVDSEESRKGCINSPNK